MASAYTLSNLYDMQYTVYTKSGRVCREIFETEMLDIVIDTNAAIAIGTWPF